MAINWKRRHDALKQQCNTQADDLRCVQTLLSSVTRERDANNAKLCRAMTLINGAAEHFEGLRKHASARALRDNIEMLHPAEVAGEENTKAAVIDSIR